MPPWRISRFPISPPRPRPTGGISFLALDSLDNDANVRISIQAIRQPLIDAITALTARVAALEAHHPVAHTTTRYIAIKANVQALPSDFTALDALAGDSSTSDILDTPDSADPATVGIFLPASEGRLLQVAELDANGDPEPVRRHAARPL